MPTLTIRNVPGDLHARLKERARRNRRSLNQEVIAELSAALGDEESGEERVARARARMRRANEEVVRLREGVTEYLTGKQVREAIDEGRA